jgi:AbiV family abortive infection protein
MTMTTTVSADVLLRGAWFALEQAGLLMEDAAVLFGRQRYATAIGLALLAREEVGRHRMLLEFWQAAHRGQPPSVKQVQTALANHTEKQRRSHAGVMLRADRDSQLGHLLATAPSDDPTLQAIEKQVRRDGPGIRHERRLAALYVDLTSAHHWNRPATISEAACVTELTDTFNAYWLARDALLRGHECYPDDPMKVVLGQALAAWVDKPTLPTPAPVIGAC